MGLQGYREPAAAQIASGLDKFMKNYFGMKTAMEQHYDAKVDSMMQAINSGLANPTNADLEKVQKWMQRSGKYSWVRTEAPNAHEKWAQQQAAYETAQQQQMQTAARVAGAAAMLQDIPGMPAQRGVDPAMQSLLTQGPPGGMPAAPQGPQPAAPAPPGFMARLGQRFGIGRPPVSAESPTGQYLRSLVESAQGGAPMNPQNVAQAGRIFQSKRTLEENLGIPLEKMSMQQQMALMQLADLARQGNPKAIETAVRSGLMKDLPIDSLVHIFSRIAPGASPEEINSQAGQAALWAQFGMPFLQHKMQWASSMMPRFLNNQLGLDPMKASLAYVEASLQGQSIPGLKPTMTFEELKQETDAMRPLMENNPELPTTVISAWANARLSGDKAGRARIESLIAKSPTKGQTEQYWKRAGFVQDTNRINADIKLRQQDVNVHILDAALNAMGQERGEIEKQLGSDDQSIRAAAVKRLNNLDLKGSRIAIPIPDPLHPGQYVMHRVTDPTTLRGATTWWEQNARMTNVPPHLETPPSIQIQNQNQPPGPPPPHQEYQNLMDAAAQRWLHMQPGAGMGLGNLPSPQQQQMFQIMDFLNRGQQQDQQEE
jgi:hypothetical protein